MKPPRTYEEEEAIQKRRDYWFHVGLLAGSFLFAVWLLGGLGILFWLPLMAWYASRNLINSVDDNLGKLRAGKYAPKGGSYHAFDDMEVRLFCDRSGKCRVAAADVFRILNLKMSPLEYEKLGRHYGAAEFFSDRQGVWWFSETSLLGWLAQKSSAMNREAMRLQRWFEREVFPPMKRKHELGIGLV